MPLSSPISVDKWSLQFSTYTGGENMNKSALEIYQEHFDKEIYLYLEKYKEWKKNRPAKHLQTKALRKAKASAKEAK
jgi:inorganic pyrophosphatase